MPNWPVIGNESPKQGTTAASRKLRKIPIGVFDPVYADLSIDEMLDRVTALGLEVMEIGTGGYPDIAPSMNWSPIPRRPKRGRKNSRIAIFRSPL